MSELQVLTIKTNLATENPAWQKKMDQLNRLNRNCFILHLLQSTACFLLPSFNDKAAGMITPITSIIPTWEPQGYPVQEKALVAQINFVRTSSFFSMLAALDHLAVLLWWDSYEEQMKRGVNKFRWREYGISSSLIITLLFMVWGNFDFG